MNSVKELFRAEDEYADLDSAGAVARFAAALRCRTTGWVDTDRIDYGEFARLRRLMAQSFPLVAAAGGMEVVGASVLFTLAGSDKTLAPALFMAHQDVVPVVPGTENDWTHGPFSGDVADGFVWGRGALDIKNMIFAELEAAEYLLAHGWRPRRTLYLAFGQDEETLNTGAKALADLLERRGVRLEFVLDEGGSVRDGALYGAPGVTVAQIGVAEKGYGDLRLRVQSRGGHSSNPFGGSSLETLAGAITRICAAPWALSLPAPLRAALAALGDRVTEQPLAALARALPASADELARCLAARRETFPLTRTTVAPTMIAGGSTAGNVLPQDMEAVINFRFAPGDTADAVLARCRAAVADERVCLDWVQCNDASRISRADGWGWAQLTAALSHFYAGLTFVPAIEVGSTDARQYERICDTCLRFQPFLEEPEIMVSGIHGTNERLSVRSYLQGVRCLIRLMESSCF